MLSFCFMFWMTWLASCMRPLVAKSMNISSSDVRETPSACACWRRRSLRKLDELRSTLGPFTTAERLGPTSILFSLPLRSTFLHEGVDAFFYIFGLHQFFKIDF